MRSGAGTHVRGFQSIQNPVEPLGSAVKLIRGFRRPSEAGSRPAGPTRSLPIALARKLPASFESAGKYYFRCHSLSHIFRRRLQSLACDQAIGRRLFSG